MDVLWAPPPTYRFMALRAVSPRAPAAFCNSSSIHWATASGVVMWTSPAGITPTRRTYATRKDAPVENPPPLGRTYRKSRPRGLEAILATLWGSLRPSRAILAALVSLLSEAPVRGCAG